jgi:hypothetical protein
VCTLANNYDKLADRAAERAMTDGGAGQN